MIGYAEWEIKWLEENNKREKNTQDLWLRS